MVISTIRSIALVGCLVAFGSANANLLTNGSFETGAFVDQGNNTNSPAVGSTVITGWTVTTGSLSWISTPNPFSVVPSDGIKLLDLTDYRDAPPYAGVTQDIATSVGAQYRLSFDLGSSDLYGRPVSIGASAGSAASVFSSSLLASGNIVWERQTLDFTALSSTTTVSLTGLVGRNFIGLDNADVTFLAAAVPEPATYALMLFGLGAVGAVARRRRDPAAPE